MRNVRERMQVLYGGLATVEMNGRPGRGTQVMLSMPILDRGAEEWAKAALAGMQGAGQRVAEAVRAMTRS